MLKLLNVAENNSQRLNQLINDLLDIEKLTAGKMHFDIKPLNIATELTQAVDNIQPFANQHRIFIESHIEPGADIVLADTLRLQQVLTNLLSNAIKFSPKESTVLLTAKTKGDNIVIAVSDSGQGISADFQNIVFQRFAQADNSNLRQHGGTGLGLAICKELIVQMGGDIYFESELGKGTTFFANLPSLKPVDKHE
jgi:signal transduction histidine kinase